MNWVIALRIQGPNKSATKSMKRGPVKGRSQDDQLMTGHGCPDIVSLTPGISFSLLFMICSLGCWAMSLTVSDWFT